MFLVINFQELLLKWCAVHLTLCPQPCSLCGTQDPLRASLKVLYNGGTTNFGVLESRLASVVSLGCAAARDSIVKALVQTGGSDCESLVPRFLCVVSDAVSACL